MGFVNRAATGLFSLMLVSALIVGTHWIARAGKRHVPAAPAQQVAASFERVADATPPFCPIPDCKMPESPPASGPVKAPPDKRILMAVGEDSERPASVSRAMRAATVIHAVSADEQAAQGASRSADANGSSVPPIPQPLPLPSRTNAVPLRPEGPELPTVEPPGSGPASPGTNSFGRQFIERALPNSTPEEREVWHDSLKDWSPRRARELLRLREELGRMPSLFESRTPIGQSPWVPTPSAPITSQPLAPAESPTLFPDADTDASRTITASLEAINQAQQVLLNNIANASTDGYKRVGVPFEGIPSLSSSGHGPVGAGVRLGPAIVDMSQGRLRQTGRALDLAIEGEGFFQLEEPQTHRAFFTRCGRFAVNASGEIVWRSSTRELRLRPTVRTERPEREIEIDSDGTFKAGVVAADGSGSAGDHSQRIQIVRLPALADLVPTGENLFTIRGELNPQTPTPPDPAAGRVRQRCLEESNVDVDREQRELESLQRQAQALERAAQTLSFGFRDPHSPANDPTTIPSHFAGSLGSDRH